MIHTLYCLGCLGGEVAENILLLHKQMHTGLSVVHCLLTGEAVIGHA
jgi:hypothetical protein